MRLPLQKWIRDRAKKAMIERKAAGRVQDEAGDPYFEHGADIGVIGRGATMEAAFEAAAAATFAIQSDPAQVGRVLEVEVDFEEEDPEMALVQWLNALLERARREHAVWSAFAVHRDGSRWHGRAWGERWSARHERGTEVKGATLTALSVRQVGPPEVPQWEARCVVDV